MNGGETGGRKAECGCRSFNMLAAKVVYWNGQVDYWKAIVDAGSPWPAGALQEYINATYALQEAIYDYMWHCSG